MMESEAQKRPTKEPKSRKAIIGLSAAFPVPTPNNMPFSSTSFGQQRAIAPPPLSAAAMKRSASPSYDDDEAESVKYNDTAADEDVSSAFSRVRIDDSAADYEDDDEDDAQAYNNFSAVQGQYPASQGANGYSDVQLDAALRRILPGFVKSGYEAVAKQVEVRLEVQQSDIDAQIECHIERSQKKLDQNEKEWLAKYEAEIARYEAMERELSAKLEAQEKDFSTRFEAQDRMWSDRVAESQKQASASGAGTAEPSKELKFLEALHSKMSSVENSINGLSQSPSSDHTDMVRGFQDFVQTVIHNAVKEAGTYMVQETQNRLSSYEQHHSEALQELSKSVQSNNLAVSATSPSLSIEPGNASEIATELVDVVNAAKNKVQNWSLYESDLGVVRNLLLGTNDIMNKSVAQISEAVNHVLLCTNDTMNEAVAQILEAVNRITVASGAILTTTQVQDLARSVGMEVMQVMEARFAEKHDRVGDRVDRVAEQQTRYIEGVACAKFQGIQDNINSLSNTMQSSMTSLSTSLPVNTETAVRQTLVGLMEAAVNQSLQNAVIQAQVNTTSHGQPISAATDASTKQQVASNAADNQHVTPTSTQHETSGAASNVDDVIFQIFIVVDGVEKLKVTARARQCTTLARLDALLEPEVIRIAGESSLAYPSEMSKKIHLQEMTPGEPSHTTLGLLEDHDTPRVYKEWFGRKVKVGGKLPVGIVFRV